MNAPSENTVKLWEKVIEEVRAILPIQNPLHSFVHNNMLMAWEKYEFWEGTALAAELYGARFPKPLAYYHKEWEKGRFGDADVLKGLEKFSLSEFESKIILNLLKNAREFASDPLLRSLGKQNALTPGKEKTISLKNFNGVHKRGHFVFPADFSEWFCLVCETYLDQGISYWPNPYSDFSLRKYALDMLHTYSGGTKTWRNALCTELKKDTSSRDLSIEFLSSLSEESEDWRRYILQTSFSMKGWLGLINKLEKEPDWFPFNHTTANLVDALSILLIVRRFLDRENKNELRQRTPSSDGLLVSIALDSFKELVKKQCPLESIEPTEKEWLSLQKNLNLLSPQTCAKLLHEAYETAFHGRILSVVHEGYKSSQSKKRTFKKDYQVLCCMDDREESLRRHIEDISPAVETFGVLGNFNLDMKFLPWDYPNPRRQCPPVVAPRRTVIERRGKKEKSNGSLNFERYRFTRSFLHARIFRSAGSLWHGALVSTLLSPFSAGILIARILFPRLWVLLHNYIDQKAFRRVFGDISLERDKNNEFGQVGYTLEEQAEIVASVLAPLGIQGKFAPTVVALAHQATTSNNPFQQAYGCGACSGNSGQVNSRVFTKMANSPEVRKILLEKHKLEIPAQTKFTAAVHDTTTDKLISLDTEVDWGPLKEVITQALSRNSTERGRFFGNMVQTLSPKKILKHVEFRSMNLAEPRPEYGHNRVAVAVFGNRNLTKQVCFDRRAFLVSYDRDSDDKECTSLKGLIVGALPVAANIGLDYFFSSIDSHGFGAGSKLPLNISALIGVVSGSRGDVRIGLASQMVELHEPVRVIAIVQAETAALDKILFSHARLTRLIKNDWLKVVSCDPKSGVFSTWTKEGWQETEIEKIDPIRAQSWKSQVEKDPAQPWSRVSSLTRIWFRTRALAPAKRSQ